MFLISQVGTEEGAENFLDRLEEDRAVRGILFRTAGAWFVLSFHFIFSGRFLLLFLRSHIKNQNI